MKTASKAVDQYYSLSLAKVQGDISFHLPLRVRSVVRAFSSLSIDSDLTFIFSLTLSLLMFVNAKGVQQQ